MKLFLRKYGTLIGLFIIILTFTALMPGIFLTAQNLRNILQQVSLLAIISMAATVVMVVGEFDLSVASVASFAGVMSAGALSQGYSIYLVIPIVLLASFLFGLFNGVLIAKVNILSFITTLASGTLLGGITFWYSEGSIIFSGIPQEFLVFGQGQLFGLRLPIIFMAVTFLVFWYIFNQTMFGRHLYAIGGNETAARYSGINTDRKKIIAFGLAALLSAMTGIILASRLGSAHPTAGEGYLLQAYATVFLGMTLSMENVPNIPGTMVGVLIMGILANGLNILGVPNYVQDFLTGAIIIAALIFQGLDTDSE